MRPTQNSVMELFNKIQNVDCLQGLSWLPDESIDCCVTSPPYFAMRDYGVAGQIGLELSPEAYIDKLVEVFTQVLRVLKKDGTCWVVIGDTYAGCGKGAANYPDNAKKYLQGTNVGTLQKGTSYKYETEAKDRDLIGIPWMLAFALRRIGFYLRQDIIWHKPNPMPESVKSRCTRSHEYIFLFTKSRTYYFNDKVLREPSNTGVRLREFNHRAVKYLVPGHKSVQFRGSGSNQDGMRNRRDVWSILVKPGYDGHHATFPIDIPYNCIRLGCREHGVVLDPFIGSGTTGVAAVRLKRDFIGFELNVEYAKSASERVEKELREPMLF